MAQVTTGTLKTGTLWYSTFYLKWTRASVNIPENYSTLNWEAGLIITNGVEWYNNAVKINSAKLNGTTLVSNKTYSNVKGTGTHKLASGSINVPHNTDGNKTISASISGWLYNNGTTSNSGSYELVSIPRQANITTAPNFNDEENPTITYSNPAGNSVDSLQACIASTDGKTIYVDYRDISKTGTSYQFPLTSAERVALRKAATTNVKEVKFYVRTILGDNTYYSDLTKNLTIVNNTPTLNPTVIDVGSASTVLTGDSNKVIKGYNNMQVSSGATVYKEATIKSQSVTCGGKTLNAGSGKINYVDSATFVFSVTDSRNNTATKTVIKTLINYVPLTCTFDAKNPTADGEMTLTVKGNYFNGSFGAVTNTLVVQYRIKQNTGSYGSWTSLTATKSGNTYSASIKLTGLDYQSIYTIQARAQDELQKIQGLYVETGEKKFKTTPIFDWSDEDFNFNVTVRAPYISTTDFWSTSMSATNFNAASVRQNGLKVLGYMGECYNFNTALTAGYYYVGGSNFTGAPYTGNIYGILEVRVTPGDVYNQKDNWAWQIFRDTSGREYHRYAVNAGGFTTWLREPNNFSVIYPVGSVVMTATNTNPSGNFGGTWTLIDKEFTPGYVSSPFTANTTNCNSNSLEVSRAGHTVYISGSFGNKVALTDSTFHIGTFNMANIGVKSSFDNSAMITGYSDGGNSVLYIDLWSTGELKTVDVNYSLTSVAAGKTWSFTATMVVSPLDQMLDSACNKFYWKRTA